MELLITIDVRVALEIARAIALIINNYNIQRDSSILYK